MGDTLLYGSTQYTFLKGCFLFVNVCAMDDPPKIPQSDCHSYNKKQKGTTIFCHRSGP